MECDKTCFAASSKYANGCAALSIDKCDGPACPFYKTHERALADKLKAQKRLERITGTKPIGKAGVSPDWKS